MVTSNPLQNAQGIDGLPPSEFTFRQHSLKRQIRPLAALLRLDENIVNGQCTARRKVT